MSISKEYQKILNEAIEALHTRTFHAQYPEHPSPKIYGETADEDGRKKLESLLNNKFEELDQHRAQVWIGEEESPYWQKPLGIHYPSFDVETLVGRARESFTSWRKATPEDRASILIDSLENIKKRFFEIAYATMHTTGQGFMMAFQASGPHANDRALEAIAMGYEELTRFPKKALWDKPMGKYNLKLNKTWLTVPKGIALVIGCSTFPIWNSVPGIYASLITGNPVIIKPHPGAVLPIAIVISEISKSLRSGGFPVDVCQIAVDKYSDMITNSLIEHPEIKIIDYTGNSDYGNYIESVPGKVTFTEKTGVNSIILDSAIDVDKVAQNLAFSLTLYSGQMCTAPQNIFIPEEGIKTSNGNVSLDDFAKKLVDNINGLVDNPKAGPFVLGSIQSQKTCDRIENAEKIKGKVWLNSRSIENPLFENARTSTPVIVEIDARDKDIFSEELFGPIALLIKTSSTRESVNLAKDLALDRGAISCGAYTTDPDTKEFIVDQMSLSATPVSFNFTGGIYVNQHASFSDFHVTGGNPSGNASFTNPEFVIKRFTWVGFREPA